MWKQGRRDSSSLLKHNCNSACNSSISSVHSIVSERWFLKLQCYSPVTAISVSGRNLYFLKELLKTRGDAQSKFRLEASKMSNGFASPGDEEWLVISIFVLNRGFEALSD